MKGLFVNMILLFLALSVGAVHATLPAAEVIMQIHTAGGTNEVESTSAGVRLDLSDLLIGDGRSGYRLASLLERTMSEQFADDFGGEVSFAEYAIKAIEQKEHWYLTEDGLVFFFEPDEIAPYAQKRIDILLPYEELGEIIQAQYLQSEPQMTGAHADDP